MWGERALSREELDVLQTHLIALQRHKTIATRPLEIAMLMVDPLFAPPERMAWVRESKHYRRHVVQLDQMSTEELLDGLERVTNDPKELAKWPSAHWPSMYAYLYFDTVFHPRYLQRFLDAVRNWNSKEATPAERKLGKRGERVVLKLMTRVHFNDKGARAIDPEHTEAVRTYVRSHRPKLLRDLKGIASRFRPPHGSVDEFRERVRKYWACSVYAVDASAINSVLERLFQNSTPPTAFAITNAILATKQHCSPKRVQILSSR